MNSILAPRSLFYGGDWHDAHWQSEVIDQETGEVALLGTVVDLGDGKRSPTVVVVRLTMELVRRLSAVMLSSAISASERHANQMNGTDNDT